MRRTSPLALSFAIALVAALTSAVPGFAADSTYRVDPSLGNSAFTAVFDATVGERITAVSSAIDCTLTVDEATFQGKAKCSVPLTSIRVDNDETKSEHFAQWATNKKVEPEKCSIELEIPLVKITPPVEPKQPVPFTTEGKFTVCGRPRDDKGSERITGTLIDLPAGTYGPNHTLRIRAKIEGFDRERYGISPKQTAGWLARVQQLADVVATQGNIDVNAFATAAAPEEAGAAK
jgi:polyisoprenoid-binding protein YceI